jgi:hypothetical protein
MSNTRKTIQINPELFKVSGASKTLKNREKKQKPKNISVNPNVLKKQLLTRIKEHKKKEQAKIQEDEKNKDNQAKDESKKNTKHMDGNPEDDFNNDEFYDSLEYLNTLSKQQKTHETNVHKRKKKKEKVENKTLKNYNAITTSEEMPYVQLELPDELKEPLPKVVLPPMAAIPPCVPEIKIELPQPVLLPDKPYGCLKNGKKPTYRVWHNSTKKNTDNIVSPIEPITNIDDTLNKEVSSRERKLEMLREKVQKQKETYQNENRLMRVSLIQNTPLNIETETDIDKDDHNVLIEPTIAMDLKMLDLPKVSTDSDPMIHPSMENTTKNELEDIVEEYNANKNKKIKRTIKRKYTLGKSKIKRQVSMLIKNMTTRKRVVDAQLNLKRESITDVKNYLKKHGLIKVGSLAPNDVVRKIYESSMLSGDITNRNKDTLLHNFMNDKEADF